VTWPFAPLQRAAYSVILCDPPWPFKVWSKRGQSKSRSERNLIVAPVREHSRKPDQAHEMLERLYPLGRRCELFARSNRSGWDCWGRETTKFEEAA
jgi:N6-adenosine-specific RNA methylase IME4